MSNGDWIKLNRKILKWEWYSDNSTRSVFLHALLKANYEPSRYKGHELGTGDVIFGRKKWAEELGLSEQQVRTAIAHLKDKDHQKKNYNACDNWGKNLPWNHK